MSEAAAPPEADRVDGTAHPRNTMQLFGQEAAEKTFLEAYNSARLHHGWLITGPRGVGKATLAWRITRFLLSQEADRHETIGAAAAAPPQPPKTLDVPADHPTARRMAALSEPRLFLLRRGWDEKTKRLRAVITVDEARKLRDFFALSAVDGGRRVVIVDTADELNPNAANALLKLLEEPPADATLLLISNQPSRLLPTIRSRCRTLRCHPLGPGDMERAMSAAGPDQQKQAEAMAELSGGSVGEALRMNNLDGMKIYADIISTLTSLPRLDRPRALALAESAAGRGKEERFDLMLHLFDLFLARTARTGASGPPLVEAASGESALMQRLCPDVASARQWAAAQQALGEKARKGRAVNLDPAALLLDMILQIQHTAEKIGI